MKINQQIVFVGFFISLCLNTRADENSMCDKLEVVKKNNQQNNIQQLERFTLMQLGFDKDARDLAVIVHNVNLPAEIKRVTFNRGKAVPTCYFKPIAFAQGGQNSQSQAAQFWGWHMLWAEPVGLFYVRVDGEAWVSSNPKTLTKLAATNPQFKQKNQTINITWQQLENDVTTNMQAVSVDEGRSWEVSSIMP